MWRQLLKRLLALNCASCEGFSTLGNAVFTSQEHAARTEVAYNLLDGMNRLAMGHGYYVAPDGGSRARLYIIHGLAAFFQLRKARLTPSPSTMMGSLRQQKNGKQTRWAAKEASKAFYGYPRAGVSGKSYTVHLLS